MLDTTAFIVIGLILAAPFVAIQRWIRWIKCGSQRRLLTARRGGADLSFMGLVLSSCACALAVLTLSGLLNLLLGLAVTPRLVTVSGVWLSGFGVLVAFFGIWQQSPYRWQGFVTGLAMLFFWYLGLALRDIGPGF